MTEIPWRTKLRWRSSWFPSSASWGNGGASAGQPRQFHTHTSSHYYNNTDSSSKSSSRTHVFSSDLLIVCCRTKTPLKAVRLLKTTTVLREKSNRLLALGTDRIHRCTRHFAPHMTGGSGVMIISWKLLTHVMVINRGFADDSQTIKLLMLLQKHQVLVFKHLLEHIFTFKYCY